MKADLKIKMQRQKETWKEMKAWFIKKLCLFILRWVYALKINEPSLCSLNEVWVYRIMKYSCAQILILWWVCVFMNNEQNEKWKRCIWCPLAKSWGMNKFKKWQLKLAHAAAPLRVMISLSIELETIDGAIRCGGRGRWPYSRLHGLELGRLWSTLSPAS